MGLCREPVRIAMSGRLSGPCPTCTWNPVFCRVTQSHVPPASVMDFAIIGAVYKGTYFLDALLRPEHIALPYAILYPAARFALWSLYTFIVGLFCTGLWVLAHECGHGAFSDSKAINNAVGWVLHSGYGAAFFSSCVRH